jgi:hypothetical protein
MSRGGNVAGPDVDVNRVSIDSMDAVVLASLLAGRAVGGNNGVHRSTLVSVG